MIKNHQAHKPFSSFVKLFIKLLKFLKEFFFAYGICLT